MLIKGYNFENKIRWNVGWNLIETLVGDMENSIFSEIPKQNILIGEVRKAGWDEKITVGDDCKHFIDGILEGVGICVYFGHAQAAFQKLLPLQSLYEDNVIDECYFITQSSETAELRNLLVNPNAKPGTNGNRITFDNLVSGMDHYHRFITVPMTIIGLEINIKNIRDNA
jgi:hypothetical protein